MGVILMTMAVLLQGNAFCVDGHRGVAGFPGDPIYLHKEFRDREIRL